MLYVLVLLCFFSEAVSSNHPRECLKNVHPITKLNITAFMGRWYEAERYYDHPKEGRGARSYLANYTMQADGTIKMIHRWKTASGVKKVMRRIGSVLNPRRPSLLVIRDPADPLGMHSYFGVLGTDHKSFAVTYSCSSPKERHVSILTRHRRSRYAIVRKGLRFASHNHFESDHFVRTHY